MLKMIRRDKKLSLILLLFFISLIVFIYIIYTNNKILKMEIIPMSVTFGDRVGFNITNESFLSFGVISEGLSAERNITIENNYQFPVVVSLISNGEISEFISYPRKFYLNKGEKQSVIINVFYPKNIPEIEKKTYTGNMNVIIKKT